MNSTPHELLNLTDEEFEILAGLLESERTKLLIGIRHTDHRAFRNELRHRLTLVERLIERCGSAISAGSGA
ncbi:hypothetical protein SBA3_710024 [Candidatus Sulfopaludibacter sp. SbA3]|nr:hypothetical protein SBA3_710024 [Candidatus Sulfopaludibacter sp. SbA3]